MGAKVSRPIIKDLVSCCLIWTFFPQPWGTMAGLGGGRGAQCWRRPVMVVFLSLVALPRVGILTPFIPLDSLYQLPKLGLETPACPSGHSVYRVGLQSRKELYVRRRCCGSRLQSPGRKQLASLSQATEKPTEQVTATLPLFSERLGMLLTHEPFSQKWTPAHHPQKWPHFLLGLVLPTALLALPQDPVSLVRC